MDPGRPTMVDGARDGVAPPGEWRPVPAANDDVVGVPDGVVTMRGTPRSAGEPPTCGVSSPCPDWTDAMDGRRSGIVGP